MSATRRKAAFLDRDGVINADRAYLHRPEDFEILPGVLPALRLLAEQDHALVVVTNQSGIARGLFTMDDYERVRLTIDALLAGYGAHIDGTWMCPHHPEFSEPCECRKPGTLLYELAAEQLGLDPARSWFMGDRLRDVEPARALGGHGVLVPSEGTPPHEVTHARREFAVVASLDAAVQRAVESAR